MTLISQYVSNFSRSASVNKFLNAPSIYALAVLVEVFVNINWISPIVDPNLTLLLPCDISLICSLYFLFISLMRELTAPNEYDASSTISSTLFRRFLEIDSFNSKSGFGVNGFFTFTTIRGNIYQ